MPPHLHPRSKFTSSLFAGTLFASFFIVALPHILPCPAPYVTYADDGSGSQRPRRRRRKGPGDEVGEQEQEEEEARRPLKVEGRENGGEKKGMGEYKHFNERIREEMGERGESDDGEEIGQRKAPKRECPMPKPGGIVGGLLLFKSRVDEKGSKPP